MALGNWTFQIWDEFGRRWRGRRFWVTRHPHFCVAIFKNWLDIEDRDSWLRSLKRRFDSPIVRRVERGGALQWRELHILTYRGPQDGLYAAVWTAKQQRGAFLAGACVFDDRTGENIGLLPSSVEWFERKLNEDLGGRLDREVFGQRITLSMP
jgi:hypothetical protein